MTFDKTPSAEWQLASKDKEESIPDSKSEIPFLFEQFRPTNSPKQNTNNNNKKSVQIIAFTEH